MSKVLNHHPSIEMLVEFSAGTLDTATSICVASHLHFCASCRAEVARLDQVGAQLMAISSPERVDDSIFEEVMRKIDEGHTEEPVVEQNKGCLLYTSPSPRDLSTSRMPSSA